MARARGKLPVLVLVWPLATFPHAAPGFPVRQRESLIFRLRSVPVAVSVWGFGMLPERAGVGEEELELRISWGLMLLR